MGGWIKRFKPVVLLVSWHAGLREGVREGGMDGVGCLATGCVRKWGEFCDVM